jgi:cytochrome c biogenesis protein
MPTVLRTTWRQLTSMRTALVLLFLLAVAAVPGSLLPQRGVDPAGVTAYYATHPALAPLFNRLSLFDVYGSPWFAAVYILLFTSLAGCVLPRLYGQVRTIRSAPPAVPRRLGRLPCSAVGSVQTDPTETAAAAARLLRGRRYRVQIRPEPDGAVAVSADKGRLKEFGNLLFHAALIVVLCALALGGLYGYKGQVLVTTGSGFADTLVSYDSFQGGRLFGPGALGPFDIRLTSFRATYQPNGEPLTYDAWVRYTTAPGRPVRTDDIRVNHPLDLDGAKVYLVGHGYAPVFVVRGADGRVAWDGPVPFLPSDAMFDSSGVVKAPDAAPRQLAFSGYFFPTLGTSANGFVSTYPAPRQPAAALLAWTGDLGMGTGLPQSVYSLDTSDLHRVAAFLLRPGQTERLPGGGSITFAGLDQYAAFQVTHDPGRGLALFGATAALAGLVVSMRSRRQRLWVRAAPAGTDEVVGRTVVDVAGLARTDSDDMTEEVTAVTTRLGLQPVGVESEPARERV